MKPFLLVVTYLTILAPFYGSDTIYAHFDVTHQSFQLDSNSQIQNTANLSHYQAFLNQISCPPELLNERIYGTCYTLCTPDSVIVLRSFNPLEEYIQEAFHRNAYQFDSAVFVWKVNEGYCVTTHATRQLKNQYNHLVIDTYGHTVLGELNTHPLFHLKDTLGIVSWSFSTDSVHTNIQLDATQCAHCQVSGLTKNGGSTTFFMTQTLPSGKVIYRKIALK
jgi:hypothetical protein